MAKRKDQTEPSRAAALVLVGVLHGVLALGLIAAFTPALVPLSGRVAMSTVDIHLPLPPHPLPASQAITRAPTGRAGAAGRKAQPRILAEPPSALILPPSPAPPVAASGAAMISGARDTGAGTGADSANQGSGHGASGAGAGGGTRLAQIAGAIDSAGDYPPDPGGTRVGKSVLITFTVGADGRVHDCRIREPSGDATADATTCRLAEKRFRFRPSTDAAGNPVPDIYGWRQRWF